MINVPKVAVTGPLEYRARAAAMLLKTTAEVFTRRAWKGPRLPGWNLAFELFSAILKVQLQTAMQMKVSEARRYLETLTLVPALRHDLSVEEFDSQGLRGTWFFPVIAAPAATLLYLHGGGYAFYPKSAYVPFLSELTSAANCRTFALNYRLAPEHKFPAQLDDALAAYTWLCGQFGADRLFVAGDSAGGNLAIALLLTLRDRGLPQPAMALAFSPATEFDTVRPCLFDNQPYDYLDVAMLSRFATWFCSPEQLSNPLVSPIRADLRNLAPLYIQAGKREVLFGGIEAFVEHARSQDADITFDAWDDMNHCFQLIGRYAPQSQDALQRASAIIANHRVPSPS